MVLHGARGGMPALLLLFGIALARSAELPVHSVPATADGACDLLLAAGVSAGGPALGLRARFRNGFEIGFRQAQWRDAWARDAGLYYLLGTGLRGRAYLGTELFQAEGRSPGLGGQASKPALLFVVGREARIAGPVALACEGALGPRLTREQGGPLPPLAIQGRMHVVVRFL